MSNDSTARPIGRGATIWALITGLAVGFAVGRETGHGGGGGSASTEEASSPTAEAKPAAAASPAPGGPKPSKIYTREADFPPTWLKLADLASVTTISFDGLTDRQKITAVQAANERNCECGCKMGSLATCVKKDPNCPRSPLLVKLAIEKAKAGKSLFEVIDAVDAKQKELGGGATPPGEAAKPTGPRKIEIASFNPRRGPQATKVTMVMWSDFQCPFCSRVEPTVKQVVDKYGKDLAVVWRNQPLPFHQNAKPAAKAAMAAARQGKFWEMHDKIFANQSALDPATFEKYAGEIGLNVGKWKKDVEDPKIAQEIDDDAKAGSAVGADGTPAFYINGRELSGAQPLNAFTAVIDEEIKKADDLIKSGTKLDDVYKKLMEQAAAAPPPKAAPPAGPPPPAKKVELSAGDLKMAPAKGPAGAPVSVVIFSDFQCPFCSRVEPTLKQLEDDYKGKLKFVWMNYPLPFHQNAMPAAEAAMAANEQGKFWQMHDKLFANQQALDAASLEKYAQELGLNVAKWKAALESHKYKDRIEADTKYGGTVGVTGTPAFFINGNFLSGAQPVDNFKKLIDEELKKKGK